MSFGPGGYPGSQPGDPQFPPPGYQPAPGYQPQPGYQPGYPPPPGYPPAGAAPWQGGPPPSRNRKPLFIGLAITGVVVLVAAVIAVVTLGGGGGKDGTPGEALTGYLEALSRGDAEAALSYGLDQPGSTDLLTDEILKKQIEKMPISDIQILSDDAASFISMASVHVRVKFGDKVSDETIQMERSDKQWKLKQAAIKIEPPTRTRDTPMETLTLFGKPVDSAAYVFPGWLDLASTNKNLKVDSEPMLLNGFSYASFSSLNVEFDLSDQGRQGVMTAIKAAITECNKSRALSPPNCPQRVSRSEAAENTVEWGMPDLSPLKLDSFSQYDMSVRFDGTVDWPLKAKKRDGGDVTGTVSTTIYGKADVSTSPPTATLS
ncbi:DUF4878 domain-containing protein [Mycolicibacillus trivialis]|uniref:Uncharacterized protein n=1 Tax=Mycolicibacillus trivialis TaxID=1798 RepID=A0A1X2EQR8_9MYCO|nr:DUF4878 domain-containing protein [Mycolicibacillus trivialis]ORX08494.1 hypothetical protein AWC30_02380 [Mycolicibacillus trivialis]